MRATPPAILYHMPSSLTILEDSRNRVAIRNDYKGIYSPMTLYEIEIKEKEIGRRRRRRERERERERERRIDRLY